MSAIATRTSGSTKMIRVTGPVTDSDTDHLRTILVTAIWHERPSQILIDIDSGVALDATAVGALVAASDIAKDQRMRLGVRCADPDLARQLAEAGIG